MRQLILDGKSWNTPDDVYDSFFRAVGAPEWHGRNFNALIDGIETGSINQIEVPYQLIIRHSASVGEGAKKMVSDFVDLIHEISARGCPVDIVVES
jgi:RNAse (barnase) inhibitor barstar